MKHADLSSRRDDIVQLKQYMELSQMNYQDISLIAERRRACLRWLLLSETQSLLGSDNVFDELHAKEVFPA